MVYRLPDGTIDVLPRAAFKQMAREGKVDARTIVFDQTAATVSDLREGRMERPVAQSWHARLLPTPATA